MPSFLLSKQCNLARDFVFVIRKSANVVEQTTLTISLETSAQQTEKTDRSLGDH